MINPRVRRVEPRALAGAFESAYRCAGPDDIAAIAADILDKAFCLIKRQLQAITIESRVGHTDPSEPMDPSKVSARILECTAALDHVYAALGPDIARMRQTEREWHRTPTA